jgi:hypothetical protein
MKVQTFYGKKSSNLKRFSYQNDWWYMFPLSMVWFVVFGFGTLTYFGFMIIQKNKNDEFFQLRFRFVLLRFKKKFFYWKIIETFEFISNCLNFDS